MSPLARAQDGEDILSVQQAVQFVLQNAGPDQAKIGFKLEDFGTWVAGKTGMPAELVRSEAEKEASYSSWRSGCTARHGYSGPTAY